MTDNNSGTQLTRGRVCPAPCLTHVQLEDEFCPACGHAFSDADLIVSFNADGTISGAPSIAPEPENDDFAAPEPDKTAVVVVSGSVSTPAAEPAIGNAPVSTEASCKIAYIEVSVDTDPRPLRPDDVVAPTVASAGYTLTGQMVPFGRMSPIVTITGDQAVSRVHGYFHRQPDGSYSMQCRTENFTEVNGVEVANGSETVLKDGDLIKIGDWFLIVYHEES